MSIGQFIGCSLLVLVSANVSADRGSRHHAPAFDGEDSQRIVEGSGQTGAEVDSYLAAACHHAHEHDFYSCVVTTGHGVAIEVTG